MEAFPIREEFMRRAFRLAKSGLGTASPNPVVGCVIVCRDRIIGEGFHHRCGEGHAEVNAINSVLSGNASVRSMASETGLNAEELLRESTLYVSLEPCAHYGKTPPCARLIIEKKIPRVVIACNDPNPKVNGGGVAMLRAAGVSVTENFLEAEGRDIARRFLCTMEKNRPYIILKWAQSADGFISAQKGKPTAVTGKALQRINHKYRAEEDAVMVGTETLSGDNPRLDARLYAALRQPLRVSLDLHGRILDGGVERLHFFDGSLPSMLFVDKRRVREYEPWCKNVRMVPTDAEAPRKDCLAFVLQTLYEEKVESLVVEGGSLLLQSFMEADLWDELRVFTSEKKLGSGYAAPTIPPACRLVSRACFSNGNFTETVETFYRS